MPHASLIDLTQTSRHRRESRSSPGSRLTNTDLDRSQRTPRSPCTRPGYSPARDVPPACRRPGHRCSEAARTTRTTDRDDRADRDDWDATANRQRQGSSQPASSALTAAGSAVRTRWALGLAAGTGTISQLCRPGQPARSTRRNHDLRRCPVTPPRSRQDQHPPQCQPPRQQGPARPREHPHAGWSPFPTRGRCACHLTSRRPPPGLTAAVVSPHPCAAWPD